MKANKMSKKSTITITVMACLLAVAVATTIVLAAFTSNKTASTTVTFTSGITIKINGALKSSGSAADDFTEKVDNTLIWACTANGTSQTTATVTDVSTDVVFDAISFENKTGENDAWIVAKATIIEDTNGNGSIDAGETTQVSFAKETGWVRLGSTDWYAYGTGTDPANLAAVTFTDLEPGQANAASFVAANTAKITLTNNEAGKHYVATVDVYAVNADASDALTTLATYTGFPASGS